MSTLRIGIHLVPVPPALRQPENSSTSPDAPCNGEIVDAEVLDITPRFCRLRIPRERFRVNPAEVAIQFAWTESVARVIWTNTSLDAVEVGLLLPDDN